MKNFFFDEGNIGRDPVLKYVPIKGEQKPVLEFDVRFPIEKQNKETGEYEDNGGFWGTVAYWGKRAEAANKILKSGVRVFVIGEISQDEFIATKGEREGQVVTVTNITADHVGLSLLGIESVNFSARKNKALPQQQSAVISVDERAEAEDDLAAQRQAEAEYLEASGR
jgi:single-strand DNA-binding protein